MRISQGIVCLCGLIGWATQMDLHSVEAAPPQTVEVTETQKAAYQAELIGFSGNSVKVKQAGQPREIPLESLMRLRFLPVEQPQTLTDAQPIEVELRGGSRIVGKDVTSDGTKLTITSGAASYSFPTKAVVSCKFRKLNATLVSQWQSFVDSQVSADMLVLVRGEDVLDKIEGLIGKVTSEAVSFKVDDQTVDAPRTKLAGMKFFSTATKIGSLAGVVRDKQQNLWMVSSIASESDRCTLQLNCGESVVVTLASIAELDLSYGNMRYLADLEPLERTSSPRFGLGIEVPESAKLFGPRSVVGRSKAGGSSVEFVGAGSITHRVPEGFTKLVGSVELNPSGQAFVACHAAIMLENKVLWEHDFDTTREPQEITLAIESGKRLKVVVDSKADQPVGDTVTFHQLRFMK